MSTDTAVESLTEAQAKAELERLADAVEAAIDLDRLP